MLQLPRTCFKLPARAPLSISFPKRAFHSSQLTQNKQKEPSSSEASEFYKQLIMIWNDSKIADSEKQDQIADLIKRYNIKSLHDPLFVETTQLIFNDKSIEPEKRFENLQKLHKNFAQTSEAKQKSEFNFNKNSQPKSEEAKVFVFNLRPDLAVLWLISTGLLFYVFTLESQEREITFQEFQTNLLDKGFVDKLVVVNKNWVYVMLNDNGKNHHSTEIEYFFSIGSVENFEHKLLKAQEDANIQEDLRTPVIYVQRGNFMKGLFQFLPTILMLAGLFWITKKTASSGLGGGLFGQGKSKAKKFNMEKEVKVKFSDVAGCEEAKEEIMEFVNFLKHPAKYEKLGAKIPRGAILTGSPGTGKTLLAKATAGEAGVPFYSVSGSEFVEMFVGVGASRVRDLFKTAREDAPSIVFVDEIDAIGKARSKSSMSGGNDERENTLNQLLVEMDGFSTSDHVVVLAGTNRADVLDSALLRPGRFDRKITIDNPELEGRKEIFDVHMRKITLNPKENKSDLRNKLATLTPGFSGADIANCCNEAALIAARKGASSVELVHFEMAIERVIAGLEKKSRVLSPQEKKIVAFHEAGHAICGWFLEHADPLLKVSIVPRGSAALGYAQYLPPDIYLYSEDKLLDRMTMTLGGRVSEELHFESITSGGSDDFEKVTAIAQKMVLECGMSEKIGFLNYNQDRGNDMTKPFSDKTAEVIDQEVYRIVSQCHERCKQLLIEKKEQVRLVAEELLSKEVITREDMIRILGKRPFPNVNDAFDKYLAGKEEV